MTASRGIRAKRSDAGQVRLTERDAAVLRFLGDQFGCPLSVVAELYGVGDRVARRHVGRLERAGFAGRLTVAGQQWVVPTRAGLRFADLEHEPWAPRAWKLEHVEQVARLRLADGRCVGIELELHRKKRWEYAGIGRDVDPGVR